MKAITGMTSPAKKLAYALMVNYAAMMSLAIAVNFIPVFLTTLASTLGGAHGLTYEQLGRIGAVTFIGLVSGILVTGPLADRFGAKRFAIIGNLLVAIGLGILGFAPNYDAVLLAVGFMGFGAGVLDMVLSPIVCALQPERRTTALNWLHSFYCVGAVATVFIGAVALRLDIEWRVLSRWLIMLPLLVALGFVTLHIPMLIEDGQERMHMRELYRKPFFIMAMLAIFLAGSTELGMAQWLPAYAEKSLHYSKWVGGMALVGFSVAMALGRMIAGMLGARVKPFPLMLFCCWSSAAAFVLACFLPWPLAALTASIAAGLTGSCLWPSMLGVTADRFPRGGASMFGMLGALGNFGGVFMPWIVGIMAEHTSLNIGIATSTFCPLAMALLVYRMRHSAQHHAVGALASEDISAR